MFENSKEEISRIIALVQMCPDRFQDKCFDLLLAAYVASLAPVDAAGNTHSNKVDVSGDATDKSGLQVVPEVMKARLLSTAARLKVDQSKLAALFDFNVDPVNYHALAVPGDSKKEKTRNVAYLLSAKTYLLGGGWVADWKEFRAMCVDQNCYDSSNNPTTMKESVFKSASAAENISLSSSGVAAAEAILAKLAGASES